MDHAGPPADALSLVFLPGRVGADAVHQGRGGSAHHTVLLWPFPHLLWRPPRPGDGILRRAGHWRLAALVVVVCGSNMLVTNQYWRQAVVRGPAPFGPTPSIPLAEYLKQLPAQRVSSWTGDPRTRYALLIGARVALPCGERASLQGGDGRERPADGPGDAGGARDGLRSATPRETRFQRHQRPIRGGGRRGRISQAGAPSHRPMPGGRPMFEGLTVGCPRAAPTRFRSVATLRTIARVRVSISPAARNLSRTKSIFTGPAPEACWARRGNRLLSRLGEVCGASGRPSTRPRARSERRREITGSGDREIKPAARPWRAAPGGGWRITANLPAVSAPRRTARVVETGSAIAPLRGHRSPRRR